jgi:hypothetical protein
MARRFRRQEAGCVSGARPITAPRAEVLTGPSFALITGAANGKAEAGMPQRKVPVRAQPRNWPHRALGVLAIGSVRPQVPNCIHVSCQFNRNSLT